MVDTERPAGSVSAEISRDAVQLFREYTGRGPTRARTTISGDLVVILLGSTLLKAERSLISSGDEQTVLHVRHKFQGVMKQELIATVERAVGRKVIAFMSDNHVDPDLAAEVFVLEPDGDGASAAQADRDGQPAEAD
jgi:uncharacterized protein YbcI